jgi:hypothetical protein
VASHDPQTALEQEPMDLLGVDIEHGVGTSLWVEQDQSAAVLYMLDKAPKFVKSGESGKSYLDE